MSSIAKRIAIAVFVLFVGSGLAFGAIQVFAAPTSTTACDLGTCPPKDDMECNEDCIDEGYFGGACNPQGCCMCLM